MDWIEYTRAFGPGNESLLEANSEGRFLIYSRGDVYASYTADEAAVILAFLQKHIAFLHESEKTYREEEN